MRKFMHAVHGKTAFADAGQRIAEPRDIHQRKMGTDARVPLRVRFGKCHFSKCKITKIASDVGRAQEAVK